MRLSARRSQGTTTPIYRAAFALIESTIADEVIE
jgi:hypothetical protein